MPHVASRRLLAGTLALLLLGACGQPPDTPTAVPPTRPATASTTPPTEPSPAMSTLPPTLTPTPTPTPSELEPLTLAFVGDMNFDGVIRPRLDGNPGSVFGPARDVLGDADLTFGNLETAITEGGAPEPKTYTFRAPATALEALEIAGFDALTMANNHGVDFGAEGLADTVTAIGQTDIPVVGIGADAAAAYASAFLEAKGRRIAFLGATQLRDETLINWTAGDTSGGVAAFDERFLASVAAADEQADLTVVYMHWAPENQSCPQQNQTEAVDDLIAAGADIVVGAHAHMLMGAGWRDRVFVAYGLGNYLWYFQRNEQTTRTGIFTVTVEGNDAVALDYAPARIQDPSGIPAPMSGAEATDAQASFDALRACTDLSATPEPAG